MVGVVEDTVNLLSLRNKLNFSLEGDSFSLASFLGYGALSGLIYFKVNPEPKKPELFKQIEVQSIYHSYQDIIKNIINGGSGKTLIDLINDVNQNIEDIAKKTKTVQSILLKNIVSGVSNNRRSYENKFRWNGVQLDRAIIEQSSIYNLRDSLVQDYNLIVKAFSLPNIDLYERRQK